MAYVRKTRDEFEIQGRYSAQYGFEVVNTEESRQEARRSAREYRENEPGVEFRIRRRRIRIDADSSTSNNESVS